jgi:hypothetical protein
MTADARARLALTAARAFLAVCTIVLLTTVLGAGRHSRIDVIMSPSVAAPSAEALDAPIARSASADGLLGRDPFDASRVAARRPYRLGAETESAVRPSAAPTVRLLGTVVIAGGRSFALCQIDGAAASVVYPGQMIGTLRLVRVDQGSAVFTDAAGARIELLVPRSDGGRNDR